MAELIKNYLQNCDIKPMHHDLLTLRFTTWFLKPTIRLMYEFHVIIG